MKYTAIFGLAALSLGFCSCDEIEDSTGLPQTNPQLPIVTVSNVPMTPDAATDQALNLITANNAGGDINLATISTPSDFPEGFVAEVLWFEIGNDANFTKKASVQATTDADGKVVAQADDWQAAHLEVFGKNPKTTTTYVRIPAWAVNGNQQIRLGSENDYYSTFSTEVTPFDLFDGHVIEDTYYLLHTTNSGVWDFSSALKFAHSSTDPYDDPVFTVYTPAYTAGWEWVVIPESTYAAGNFVNAPESSYGVEFAGLDKGVLIANDTDDYGTPGVVNQSTPMVVTINMAELTYEISALPVLYTPGTSNGWDFGKCQPLLSYEPGKYHGFVYINGEFKFTSEAGWSGTNYGYTGTEGKLSTDGGAGNLQIPADGPGLYFIDVNTTDLTYKATYISAVSMPGNFNGWDVTANMASDDYLHWTLDAALDGGEFKFAFNNSWDLSYGGASYDLQFNGPNSTAPAGNYLVTLDLSSVPYSFTLTSK